MFQISDTNYIRPKVYNRTEEFYGSMYLLPTLFSIGLALFLFAYNVPKQLTAIVIGGLVAIPLHLTPHLAEKCESLWHADTLEIICFPFLILRLMCSMDMHIFLKSLHQILIISISTTYIPGLTVAYVILAIKGFEFSSNNVLLIGLAFSLNSVPTLLAIANPVKNFEVLLCSEAVFSMVWGLPLIRYSIMSESGLVTSMIQFACLMTRSITVAIFIGCLVGNFVSALFKYIYFDVYNTVAALIGVSYFTYCLCVFEGGCNGSLGATVALFFVLREKSRLSTDMSPELLSIIKLLFTTMNTTLTVALIPVFISHALTYGTMSDIGSGFAAYILLNAMRVATFFVLAPVLSRIGYGLNIDSLWAMSLGMAKGATQLIILLKYDSYGINKFIRKSLFSQIVLLMLLMSLVNELLGHFVLKAVGVLKLSNLHQHNIGIAIRTVLESRFTMLSMIKMNRFFSDANWPTIYAFTDIRDLNMEKDGNVSDFTYFNSSIRKAQCPSCHKTVAIEPTATEYIDMIREVRLRVLKMNRVSFMRQYEQGIINKNELMGLLQAVEVAFDSEEKELKIDDLITNFLTKSFSKKLKKCLLKSQVIKTELQPRTKCRKYCYKLSRSFKCLIPLYLIDIAYLIIAIANIVEGATIEIVFYVFVLFYMVFTAEEIVIIIGLSVDSVRQGFRRYLRNLWNLLDFTVLLVHYTEVFLLPLFYFLDWNEPILVFGYLRLIRMLVLIKIILFCERLFPNYLTCLENFTDSRICYSFTVGRGLIVSYDEIINILPNLCDNLNIRQTIKDSVVSKKLRIMERLAIIQKERPWISVTVETKQALGATLKGMHDSLEELKSAGYVDIHEYNQLMNMLKERQKIVATYKSVDPPMPKTIFFEVGYLCDDLETLEYMYDNILMKVWKTGEIIADVGEQVPGIYVIVAGVIKMTYKPQEKYLERLKEHGALPIKKNLSNINFNEEQVDYYMIGNTIGELSNLTERENSCTYEAHTPCQAFIVPANILYDAFKKSNDPVNGLRPRMWKYFVTDLAKKVLLTTYAYHSLSQLSLNLERAIVPDLKRFRTLVLTDLVEDVILIDGIIVDYSTRDIFVAPCYIPRSVQRMILSDQSVPGSVPTKLMILPMRDIDEYDVMLKAEMQSEMVSCSQTSLYEPLARYMEEKSVKRKASLMMLKKAMGNKIFKTRSQTLNFPKMQKTGLDMV